MTPREFYNRRLEEDNTIGSVQLMEEYAKHIIEMLKVITGGENMICLYCLPVFHSVEWKIRD